MPTECSAEHFDFGSGCGARAAIGDAGDRVPQRPEPRRLLSPRGRVSSWPERRPPPMEPSKQPTNAQIKFSKKRLALAIAIAGISDAIGAFATPLPPIVWVVDLGTALLLFMVLGRQWLLLPGLALEAIPGLGVLPFWLLVVGAIAVLGTPRPTFERH
jgi:hypothetical protein